MQQYYLGVNLGHERSVALVKEGQIVVAIEQERLDRHKYSVGFMLQAPDETSSIQIPNEAISYCLDSAGITLANVAAIVPNMPGHDVAPDIVKRAFPKDLSHRVIPIPSHHLAHAYSAFWPSNFDEAVVLVIDATGSTNSEHRTESYTIYEGRGQTLTVLHSETVAAHLATLSTLGFIYEYITMKAGFVAQIGPHNYITHPEAGKLMGLAPYGREQPYLHRWIHTKKDSYSLQISAYDIFLEVAALEKRYDNGAGKPYLRPYLVDLAYKVQQELEQALLHLVALAIEQTGLRKVCIAGGVGLNSVANYKLLRELNLEDIFIFPAAGDAGIAAGYALWAYHTLGKGSQRPPLKHAALGRRYSQAQIIQALQQFDSLIAVEELESAELLSRSAEVLAQGQIVARFEGRSEYGPRALGQRSIMVDPTFAKIKDVLNARVKFREAFRPFAPVIPLEQVNQVFELKTASPFMLLVPPLQPAYQDQLPGITHVDGTGRVQTVTAEDNPYFYQLCWRLAQLRQGPAVLLNTSFNIAGQPIVETPQEAIQTFLHTDIDYLALEHYWITKRQTKILDYQAHLKTLTDTPLPHGLPSEMSAVTDLMAKLDRALFWQEMENGPWSAEELRKLSAQGGRYKETSVLFPESPLPLRSQLAEHIVLLLDPLGQSVLADLTEQLPPTSYSFDQVKLLLTMLEVSGPWQENLRLEWRLTHAEFAGRLEWANSQLQRYQWSPKGEGIDQPPADYELLTSHLGQAPTTLAAFADEQVSVYHSLGNLRTCLQRHGYTIETITTLLKISSLQDLEPTYFHFYNHHRLPHTAIGELIRLFLLHASLSQARLCEIFGDDLWQLLVNLGILIPQGEEWASSIDLFCAHNLYFATDHRYLGVELQQLNEEPVMYIGADSLGLTYTAPQFSAERLLDLCCGCGIQGLVASRYTREVIGVDVNPRAIRFARFNAQLNGIRNFRAVLGNLYEPVKGYTFDTILVNPPFVPSPHHQLLYRDGGSTGEKVLKQIIEDSFHYLAPTGRLFIVSDLVNVKNYEAKLGQWWKGGPALLYRRP